MNKFKNEINEYKKQLKEKEKLALEKAEEILGDSFEIEKSLGFLEWKKINPNIIMPPIKIKPKLKKK
tara:strand:+ start:536 stop:736 length:201 start_codon:yes stop_codon:yes gene_type:complete